MLNIRDVRIDPTSLGDKMMMVNVLPAYEYKDGKRTDNIVAYRYEVALPAHNLDKISVRIDGKQLMDAPEDGFVEVKFTGLEVSAYERDGKVLFTAKATGITAAGHNKP